jgi:SAM-dependent methyltransferase
MNFVSDLEKRLTMPRDKPRSAVISAAYSLQRAGAAVLGKERMLRFFLTSSWLFWRFAFEVSGELYGGDFHLHTKALSEDYLKARIPENGSVIDIGCGVGRWCGIASKYAGSVVGIDYDENLIRQARETVKANNVEFIVGDVTKDLDNRRFDLAILTHVIEHIENTDEFLRQLQQVAHRIIVEVPDFGSDPLNWARLKQATPFYSDADHVKEYTLETLSDQMKRTGWKVLENYKNGGAVLVVGEVEGWKS